MKKTEYRIPLFCIVTSLYWFSLYAFVPNLPLYAESLGASHKMIGLILGSYGFTQMIIRIPLGIYSDAIGRRKIFILLGIAIAVTSALGMALLPTPGALLFFRGLTGVAAAAWVTFTVLFSSYFAAEEAPKALGYINSFNALGQMLAMLLGGILARRLGSRAPFLLAAAVGTFGFILGLGIVEKPVKRETLELSSLLEIGREKGLLFASGLAILIQVLTFATVYGFTPVAAQKLGADEFQRGLLTTLSTMPTIFASAMSGSVFAKKFGEKKILVVGFATISLSCAIIPMIHSLKVLYLTQMIGGFARGVIFPLLMGLSIKTVDIERRATAMGFFQAVYGLGMFLGPVLVGFISDMVGLSWGFWIVSILGVTGSILSGIFVDNTF